MINVSDIMISNRVETTNGDIYKISFFEKIIVDDFECRCTLLEALICQKAKNEFDILENNGYSEDEIMKHVLEANKTKYTVHYYDVDSKDLKKEEVTGLKNIAKLNQRNNVIDIIKI